MSPLALASRTDRACVGPELSRESDATRAYRRKMETGPRITRDLTLLTAWFCPFAQRTWIALAEKGISFKLEEVAIKDPGTGFWKQLSEKPAWFTKLNPVGKVPTLVYRQDDGQVKSVYESLICNEFLEDFAPSPEHPALFPGNPADKARARMIIDSFDRRFVPEFYRILNRQDQAGRDESAHKLATELLWLEELPDKEGPYFLGKQFSAVECALLPWFIRLYILKHYRGFEMPKECRKLFAWYHQAMLRESVQSTLQCPDEEAGYEEMLLQHYSRYADGTANSTSARDFR